MYDVRCRSDSVLLLHNPRCRLVITFLLALLLYALVCKFSKRKQYKQLSRIQDLLNFCMIICVKSKSGKLCKIIVCCTVLMQRVEKVFTRNWVRCCAIIVCAIVDCVGVLLAQFSHI